VRLFIEQDVIQRRFFITFGSLISLNVLINLFLPYVLAAVRLN